jgi:aquaglyceroporin related protein
LFIVTRADETNRTDSFERGVGREDQYKENQPNPDSHFGLQSPTLMPDSMGDNFHGDHPPLEDNQSSHTADTAETQAEKKDNRDREKQAIQNYYNTYRNPLARLRARYPEAFAEFLAVSLFGWRVDTAAYTS